MQIKVDRRKHSITTQKHNLPQNKLCSNYLFITFATARVRRYKSFCVRYCRKALLVAVYSTDRHVCWDYVSVVQFVGSDSVRLTFKKKQKKQLVLQNDFVQRLESYTKVCPIDCLHADICVLRIGAVLAERVYIGS